MKTKIDRELRKTWATRWHHGKDSRQTRIFLPAADPKKARELIKKPRNIFSRLVQFITGHNFARRHQGLVDKTSHGMCRLCSEEEETSSHLINNCKRLYLQRRHYFDIPTGDFITPDWSVSQLAAFIQDPLISWVMDGLGE